MNEIRIGEYCKGRERELSDFIRAVFDEFVGHDYSKEGNDVFYEFIRPESIAKRHVGGNLMLIAETGERIVGFIELRDGVHICVFFVAKEYQGKGIGRRLLEEMLNRTEGMADYMEVNSSPYAVPIYKAMGFRATDSQKEADGIKFVPMRMER